MLDKIRTWARALKRDGLTLWFCCRHPDMPLLPKLGALFVVGYALSPIDLIPDFIPVLGYLDDLILLPVFIYLILKLIPEPVLVQSRAQADAWIAERRPKPRSMVAATVILLLWALLLYGLWHWWGDDVVQWWRAL